MAGFRSVPGRTVLLGVLTAGIFGLTVPQLSALVLFAYWVGTGRHSLYWLRRSPRLRVRAALLSLFAVTYFAIVAFHEYLSLFDAAKYPFLLIASYLVGYALARRSADDPAMQLWGLLAPAGGSAIFAFLCVWQEQAASSSIDLIDRATPNFWNPSVITNGTGTGALASLGLCLFPLTVFVTGSRLRPRDHLFVAAVAALFASAGAYANTALQNRSPFIALAVALCVALLIFLRSHSSKLARTVGIGAFVSTLALVGWALFGPDGYLTSRSIGGRFGEMGLQTPRYQAWALMLTHIADAPLGGRTVDVGLTFVHNLWLDVAHDAGLLPFCLLLAFHALHYPAIYRVTSARNTLTLSLAVGGLTASLVVAFMVEPILDASPSYFATSCYFLGFVLAASENLRDSGTAEPLGPTARRHYGVLSATKGQVPKPV